MQINRTAHVAAVTILLTATLLVAGVMPYMFLYLACLTAIIPYFRLMSSLKGLTGEISVAARTQEVGQSFEVKFTVSNSHSGRFPYLELSNESDSFTQESPFISLDSGETKEITTQVFCRRRGIYDLQTLIVKTGDPFGLFQIKKPLAKGGEVKVYPRIRHFPEITLPSLRYMGEQKSQSAIHENPGEPERLREWQDGDNTRRIHWRQSSRHGKIIVRNFEKTADAEFALFVDAHTDSYLHDEEHRMEDLAVELAASLVYRRLGAGLPLLLFADPDASLPLRGKMLRDYEQIMDHLVRLSPKHPGSVFAYLRRQSYSLSPGMALNIMTTCLTLADADLLLSLKRRGFTIALFYVYLVAPGTDIEEIMNRLRQSGVLVSALSAAHGELGYENRI